VNRPAVVWITAGIAAGVLAPVLYIAGGTGNGHPIGLIMAIGVLVIIFALAVAADPVRAAPMTGTTGDIEALSMWAGQGVTLARQPQPAADIVTELTSRL
jgi:hypothetical protein